MCKHLRSLIFIWLLLIACDSRAQSNHFIYLQTDSRQPFYARIGKTLYSSSASGYLIIPKLHTGDYAVAIGFPKAEKPEQLFNLAVTDKDAGYLVKDFGEKGWGLFNLQTMDVVMAGNGAPPVARNEKTDAFSSMLSDVVNDPSIKAANNQPVKKDTVAKAELKAIEEEVTPQKSEVKSEPVVVVEPVQKPVVKPAIFKQEMQKSAAGTSLIYIDRTGDAPDTVQVFIPVDADKKIEEIVVAKESEASDGKLVDTGTVAKSVEKDTVVVQPEIQAPPVIEKVQEKAPPAATSATDKKFLAVDMPAGDSVAAAPAGTVQMINSDCVNQATDEDFLKLRKKMAAADNDEAMVAVAQKLFKQKCFTTSQVKNLSVLFLKDEGKYRFFDMAYPRVSDSAAFPALEKELTDAYYINRFKAMVKH